MTSDHLGSPRIVTDANGAVVSRKDFAAFGDETITSHRTATLGYNIPDIRQDYTGYLKDEESGLEYAQARYYNIQHGRFTSVDPLPASATIRNPQSFNRYSYVLNSPYKFTDPLGLFPAGGGGCGHGRCVSTGNDNNWWTENAPMELENQTAAEVMQNQSESQAGTYTAPSGTQPEADPPAPPPDTPSAETISGGVAEAKILENFLRGFERSENERFAKQTGIAPTDEGTGVEIPDSKGPNRNCFAQAFGMNAWVDFNTARSSPVYIGSLAINASGQVYFDTSSAYPVGSGYTQETAPEAFGARRAGDGERTPIGHRRLRVFIDPNRNRNWHIIRLDRGGWSSKNGVSFEYANITSPNVFYAKHFRTTGFRTIDFFVFRGF